MRITRTLKRHKCSYKHVYLQAHSYIYIQLHTNIQLTTHVRLKELHSACVHVLATGHISIDVCMY